MSIFVAELIGTALLILFGNGVVANVVLKDSKGQNGGWIVITFGWCIAVFVGVYSVAAYSGAHLNPAVTIALAILGKIPFEQVPTYIIAQFLGAMIGTTMVYIAYKKQYDATTNGDDIRATFCNTPAIPDTFYNLMTEIIGTFALIMGVLFIVSPKESLGALDALPVALLVLGIGLSLGGPTGYAINPARDLGPRIMHALLPIRHKGDLGWSYAWIPVVGPVIGSILAAGLFSYLSL